MTRLFHRLRHRSFHAGRVRRLLAATLLAGVTLPASATVISVDVNATATGVDSASTVDAGTGFTVDIVLDTEGADITFDGFEIGLDFDTSLLAVGAAGASVGSDFAAFSSSVVSPDPSPPGGVFSVSIFDLSTFGPVSFNGVGVLASIAFDAQAAGISPVSLRDTALTVFDFISFSTRALPAGTANATVTVVDAQAVPSPAPALLLAPGLAAIGLLRRRRARAR